VDKATHLYEVRPRRDRRGFDLISEALPFGRLWYAEPNAVSNAINYAKFRSRSPVCAPLSEPLREIADLLLEISGGFRIVAVLLLNFGRQLGERNLDDSARESDNDAVRFDAAHLSVFVFFAVDRFEVVSEND
jgi:hypothetical protein